MSREDDFTEYQKRRIEALERRVEEHSDYIDWLERMIEGCVDLGGMEREKAVYQNCLKKIRKNN